MITMGTVMEIEKKKALVFTMDGSVVYIKPRLGLFVGQQVAFTRKELAPVRNKMLTALPFAAVAAVLVVALVAASFLNGGLLPVQGTQQCAAYIALDINPSVQFKIDEDGRVISAAALNEDGRTLLASLELAGKAVDDAVDATIARAKALGYIQDEKSVVLVAGVLNEENSTISGNRSEYKDKLQAILGGLGSKEADVLALYIDDSTMKDKADQNGVSLGRELLREFAQKNNIDMADEEVRSGRITDLLDKFGDNAANCLPEVTPQPTATPEMTDEPTESPTMEPTDKPTALPTDSPKPTETAEPTEKPTAAPTKQPTVSGVSASVVSNGIKVTWPKATAGDGKFLYYKIVLSVNDATPKYPESGYAKVISDKFTLSTVIEPNSGYSGGDVGGKVKPGVSYYVSVTYVYENEVRAANAVRVKCPEPEPEPTAPPASSDYSVTAFVSGDSIRIKWDKSPTADGFNYYKVVLSKGDSSPKYPDNGYLQAISNIDTTACTASPGDGYSGGDIGGELKPGQAYYISVTYVYDGYRKYGNTVRVTMPGEPAPEEELAAFSGPTCSATLDGTTLKVSWKKLPADSVSYGGRDYHDFQYYKVVIASHANPKYPDDGYVDVVSSIGSGYSEVSVEGGDYTSGSTWYVAITYVFSDGKIYSSDDSFTIP